MTLPPGETLQARTSGEQAPQIVVQQHQTDSSTAHVVAEGGAQPRFHDGESATRSASDDRTATAQHVPRPWYRQRHLRPVHGKDERFHCLRPRRWALLHWTKGPCPRHPAPTAHTAQAFPRHPRSSPPTQPSPAQPRSPPAEAEQPGAQRSRPARRKQPGAQRHPLPIRPRSTTGQDPPPETSR